MKKILIIAVVFCLACVSVSVADGCENCDLKKIQKEVKQLCNLNPQDPHVRKQLGQELLKISLMANDMLSKEGGTERKEVLKEIRGISYKKGISLLGF